MTTIHDFIAEFPIEHYQTLIGALVGFGGVALTLLWNAWQNRRATRRESRGARLSLLSAFYGELAAAQDTLAVNHVNLRTDSLAASNIDSLQDSRTGLSYFFEQCPQAVYQHNVDKVGALGARMSFAIVSAYSRISQVELVLPRLQARLDASAGKGLSLSEVDGFAIYFQTASHDVTSAITLIKCELEKSGVSIG